MKTIILIPLAFTSLLMILPNTSIGSDDSRYLEYIQECAKEYEEMKKYKVEQRIFEGTDLEYERNYDKECYCSNYLEKINQYIQWKEKQRLTGENDECLMRRYDEDHRNVWDDE